jgi:hypothetical protein
MAHTCVIRKPQKDQSQSLPSFKEEPVLESMPVQLRVHLPKDAVVPSVSSIFPEWALRRVLSDGALVVNVNPMQISGKMRDTQLHGYWRKIQASAALPRSAKSGLNRLARATRPFAFSGTHYTFRPLEGGQTHKLMMDVWQHRHALEQSETFRQISEDLLANGIYRHKRYEIREPGDITTLMQTCFLDLLISMDRDGYQRGKKSKFATGGLGKALIWKDGTLWHENGATHRLAAARIVGVQSGFPLRIVGAHRDWLRSQVDYGVFDLKKLADPFKTIKGWEVAKDVFWSEPMQQ